MPPAAFEPTISAGERPQTHALDRSAKKYLVRSIDDAEFGIKINNFSF